MHLTIFGASGRTGRQLTSAALAAGHDVRALVRTPAKLDIEHERLEVHAGDIGDEAAVRDVVRGADAVLSVLGPTSNTPEYAVSAGMQHIVHAMKELGVRRLVMVAGAGVGAEGDAPKLVDRVIGLALRLAARHVLEDMVRTVAIVRASDLDWTVVRVPMLTDAPASGDVKIGMVGKGTGPRIGRADLARFVLEEAEARQHVRRSPMISG
jgi:putative NADH-flavin reductase